jgi:hypothetical protein
MNDLGFFTINTMISLSVPGVVQLISQVLYSLIFMDILQTDKWLNKYFKGEDETEDECLNAFFCECGFSSMKVFSNLGSTLFYLLTYLGLWAALAILYLFKIMTKKDYLYNVLIKRMKWNWSLSFFFS